MKLREAIDANGQVYVSKSELFSLQEELKRLFSSIGINFRYSPHHFFDRVNDKRNRERISYKELKGMLVDAFEAYKDEFSSADKLDGVIFSNGKSLNIPFQIYYNHGKGIKEFVPLTILRKHNFITKDRKFVVEHIKLKSLLSKVYFVK